MTDINNEQHCNNLSNAEIELLDWLAEEAAEVIYAAQKIKRHGYCSYNPYDKNKIPNKQLLEKELGHFLVILNALIDTYAVHQENIDKHMLEKLQTCSKYLHYNEVNKS